MIAKAIESYGLDSSELFRRAGLDPARLTQPLSRFSYGGIQRLWAIALESSGDPGFGLRVSSFWHPTTYHALGYSWLASRNLEEAFERLIRYSSVVNTAAKDALRIDKTDGGFRLIVDLSRVDPAPLPVAMECGMATILGMCRSAYGSHFRPLVLDLHHAESGCSAHLSELFDAPVRYSRPEYALVVEPAVVAESLTTANPELVRVNDQVVTDYLARLDRDDIVMRVRSELIERLPYGRVGESEIAAALNLSLRSLQRKLGNQGVSFSRILDDTRRDLGMQYVRSPQYSLNEIAYLLGFTEPANFSRAFKRWYGQPPSRLRESA